MNIAVQLFTLRNQLTTYSEFANTLEQVKKIGYDYVELAGYDAITLEQLTSLLTKTQLNVCSTHNGYIKLNERLDELIKEHHQLGSKLVGTGSIPTQFRSAEGYKQYGQQLSEVGRILRSEGLSFVYHNHDFEFINYDGKTGMQLLLEYTDPEYFFFELDLYWLQRAGANPEAWIKRLKDRVKIVHLKDMETISGGEQRFAEVGEGNMDYSAIIATCIAAGVAWGVVEQDQCYEKDPLQCIHTSYQNIRSILS